MLVSKPTPRTIELPPDRGTKYICEVAFVAAVLVVLIAPLVLMPILPAGPDSEKRELAEAPELMHDGEFNEDVLSDAGAYLEDHFAFRQAFVELKATIDEYLFMTSATPNVVCGRDGWLYYSGEFNDYRRDNPMSDKAIENVAINVALMQEAAITAGKRFVFVCPPNKSTVAPNHMAPWQLAGEGPSNLERLEKRLYDYGVSFISCAGLLGPDDYFKRDSHWNDVGASRIAEVLLTSVGKQVSFPWGTAVASHDHVGDLDIMLHPLIRTTEPNMIEGAYEFFEITNEAKSVEENYVVCHSNVPGASGSVIVYRDSFSNNLAPPIATTFETSVFTKYLPYDMGEGQVGFADTIVVERTERHLFLLATDPSFMPGPTRNILSEGAPLRTATTVYAKPEGPYLRIEGTLDEIAESQGGEIMVELTRGDGTVDTHACFHVSEQTFVPADYEGQDEEKDAPAKHIVGDAGYRCYIPLSANEVPRHVRVLVGSPQLAYCVSDVDL